MTQEEYEQVCKMIDDNQTLVVRSNLSHEWIITTRGVTCLKEKIKTLVKE